jgi:hypothetical protein
MKPIDVSQVNKVTSGENLQGKKTAKTGDKKFEELFEAELNKVVENQSKKVDNIMPSTQLLNITHLNDDKIFAEKGLQLCNRVEDILSKVISNVKDNQKLKNLFANLNDTLKELSKVSENIKDEGAKDVINRTIFLSNIELEKYVRGDYS